MGGKMSKSSIVTEFNTSAIKLHNLTDQAGRKINNNINDLYSTLNQLDLIGNYRILYLTTGKWSSPGSWDIHQVRLGNEPQCVP